MSGIGLPTGWVVGTLPETGRARMPEHRHLAHPGGDSRVLKAIGLTLGALVVALVLFVAGYYYIFSASSHEPTSQFAPGAYAGPVGPVIVFGGTRATGLDIVRRLRARGEDVTVAVRRTSKTDELKALGVKTVIADALNADEVKAAFASGQFRAVVSTLGTSRGENDKRPDFVGNRNVIDAAKAAGVQRFVFITVVGTGNSYEAAPRPARIFLKDAIALKGQAEDHLRASGLQYTIIRPGGLGEKKGRGKAYLTEDPLAFSYIAREDLADLAVQALGSAGAINKTFNAYDPTRKTMAEMFRD
jgi:uncharacterized protein YbjT (DUF2867 family)